MHFERLTNSVAMLRLFLMWVVAVAVVNYYYYHHHHYYYKWLQQIWDFALPYCGFSSSRVSTLLEMRKMEWQQSAKAVHTVGNHPTTCQSIDGCRDLKKKEQANEIHAQDDLLNKKATKIRHYSLIVILVAVNVSIWNESRYAPNRNPNTGPNAAIVYINPI